MASFYDYIDSDQYLPGEVYRAQVSRFNTPMDRAEAMQKLRMNKMDFKPDDMSGTTLGGEAFATFAGLQSPNAFFSTVTPGIFPKGLMNNRIPGLNFEGFLGV